MQKMPPLIGRHFFCIHSVIKKASVRRLFLFNQVHVIAGLNTEKST